MKFTQAEIEQWLRELGEEADRSEWQAPFKLGYGMALTGVLRKMDERRRDEQSAQEDEK